MSFTKGVKKELASLPIQEEEMLVEFASFLNLNAEYTISEGKAWLDFKTNNPVVAQRILKLIRSLYRAETMLLTKKEMSLKQNRTIIIRMLTHVDLALNEHDYLGDPFETMQLLLENDSYKKTALRVAFMLLGSVNDPKKAEYHLEMATYDKEAVLFIQQWMNFFDLNAKIIKRRNKLVVYLKEAEAIRDFLQLIGAQNAVFKYEDVRIKRDFNNSINRIMNCEIANENKTMMTAYDQIKDIELIRKHEFIMESEHPKLKQVMDLRMKFKEASLRELVTHFEDEYHEKMSRSGLNHRFEKIKQLANQIKEGSQNHD